MRYNIEKTEAIMQAEFAKCGMLRAYELIVDCIGGEEFSMVVRLPESFDSFQAKRMAENIAIDCVFYETQLLTNYVKISDIGLDGIYEEFVKILEIV